MITDWKETVLRIHLAGTFSGRLFLYSNRPTEMTEKEYSLLMDYPYSLESYHYIGGKNKTLSVIRDTGKKIFLDSGAFSMFTKGIELDLREYAAYIKDSGDIIEVASVLDGIGDPELTLTNQKKLEDLGVEVLPCFHYGEDPKYLQYYLENYDHITLGGMVPISTSDLRQWLDYIWEEYLTDQKGFPIVKVHGFGLTALDLMKRYPWYSVDSTSWVMTAMFGGIYWDLGNGRETKLTMSDQSPKKKWIGMHYDTLAPIEQDIVRQQIEDKGFDVEELRSIYWKRDLWNIQYFKDLCDMPAFPFILQDGGLF